MILLDGTKVSLERAEALKEKVVALGFVPKLVIFQVGNRADSTSYIKRKKDYGAKLGFDVELKNFPEDISQEELEKEVDNANKDDSVHGIIVQLPLPDHLDSNKIINHISENKDADGLTSASIYKLVNNEKGTVPATARGILTMLNAYDVEVTGKKVVVVGRSLLVGKSTALNLINNDATVTVAHRKTENLQAITKQADILIVAIGQPQMITKDYIGEGQVVVDVGISPLDETIKGDVHFDNVKDIVGAISPVPGGVGPMTVVSLFENVMDLIESNNG
ncbi:bifunctional 5,10-methylenetetrahydrofolate dehydrogenase/5,10-methenyltetrahydrofolate cyclohydrolase [Candidatus Nomurabacteria bacterium]|nr:bifunctional 5,10-methylenetetrahydrofolate dehydrogenase/5,10-methenyltetrahydrofolate cyclohydrolase [Candidatus Nomurabacteria bacterium]